MKKRRRHFYHCTDQNRGDTWTAARVPPIFIGDSEPDTPRLCVCRTVAGCFAARLFAKTDVYVYKTAIKRSGIKPVRVFDSLITGERWIIPPVEMVFVRKIPAELVADMTEDARAYVMQHRRGLPPRQRINAYAKILPILKAIGVKVPRWEEHFVTKVVQYFEQKEDQ